VMSKMNIVNDQHVLGDSFGYEQTRPYRRRRSSWNKRFSLTFTTQRHQLHRRWCPPPGIPPKNSKFTLIPCRPVCRPSGFASAFVIGARRGQHRPSLCRHSCPSTETTTVVKMNTSPSFRTLMTSIGTSARECSCVPSITGRGLYSSGLT
jgi:hypothetical protein